MNVDEDYVQTLLNMGFPSESDIRRSLQLGKNDLNEAVAILTNEHPTLSFDSIDEMDCASSKGAVFGAQDVSCRSLSSGGGGDSTGATPIAIPPLLSASSATLSLAHAENTAGISSCRSGVSEVDSVMSDKGSSCSKDAEDENLEFPVANLIELENRVFTESWSIPYKENESLGRCLLAATKLAKEGLCESDEHCCKFVDRCMPECFQKLLTASVVLRWDTDIQEGIYDMLQMLVDLVAERLQHPTVPVTMLQTLALAFNPDTEYHTKNKSRRSDYAYWERKFGVGQVYAVNNTLRDPYGWLCDLINKFAEQKGFDAIKTQLSAEDTDAPSMAALLSPIGACAEMLNSCTVQTILSPAMEKAVNYVQDLAENDLKEKKVGAVCDLLASMKLMCLHLWPHDVASIDELRLNVALRLLKSPHFNARMNSLKEVAKLIEDSSGMKMSKTAIKEEKIVEWLVNNRVLSIALEGNIDQGQYCDKVKNIMDFIGSKLSIDELTKIWKMQNDETSIVVDNIHAIVAAGGVKFNSQQLEHLFILIQKSWQVEDNRHREKLLSLIGRIGRDSRSSKTTSSVLELLWDLAHLPVLPTPLVQQALDEHLAILNDSFVVKEAVKKSYVMKCVDDIKEGKWVLPALKQLLQITKNIAKHSFHKAEKGILQELNKTCDIIKLVTSSLTKFHQVSAAFSKDDVVSIELQVDGRYSHKDYVDVHLSFLQFVLQEGSLYLPWHRARDLWDTLVDNPVACSWDKETCYDWLTNGISDLEQDSQSQLFQKEILQLNPAKLSEKGFTCFRCFFEKVNQNEHRLKKAVTNYVVEKCDLLGLDFLWEVCLQMTNNEIAEQAVTLLIEMAYTNLSARLKRDAANLHKKFIDECYSRLEAAMIPLSASAIAQVLSAATRIVTAVSIPETPISPSPSRSSNLLSIERLLLIAERYVLSVEDLHTAPRAICPHGAAFPGQPVVLRVTYDSPKMEFDIKAHSNESVGSVRAKVARKMKLSPDSVQLVANDKMLTKDHKLLHQLQFDDQQSISARTSALPTFSTQESSPSGAAANRNFNLEQEKQLPGVVMSQGGHVYKMLYQLADLDEPRITSRAASLLKLIPTDPYVKDELEYLGQKSVRQSPASGEEDSPRTTPKNSPRKHVPPPSPNTKARAKTVLRNMFDTSAPEMSTFRVLYNLQVLSSQLTPNTREVATLSTSPASFCEDFVAAGGISLVVGVLQPDAIAAEVDYGTRQGCYTRALQLLRFLLCNQDVNGESMPASSRMRHFSSGSVAAAAESTDSRPPSMEIDPASKAIQMMSVADFTEMISCFVRVAWAAAAGKLHLANCSPIARETTAGSGYTRQVSTSSTASSGSESDGSSCLHAGICARQTTISARDAHISCDALSLLVTSLEMRSDLIGVFYAIPRVGDFVIDVLVGCSCSLVRDAALHRFDQLNRAAGVGGRQQLLHTLLGARLPFWVSSSNARGASHRLLKYCSQYFELRCRLLQGLTAAEQDRFQLDVVSMMDDELGWLANFVPSLASSSSASPDVRHTDNVLQEGHLKLVRTLLTCDGVDKMAVGSSLLHDLLHEFLFPASKIISDDHASKETLGSLHSPKCSLSESRVAAYELLVELAHDCLPNMRLICGELINMHHLWHPETSKQWEHMPPVMSRSSAGFVGLKNGGATCYMNSVIQQLYLAPGVTEAVLAMDDDKIDEDSVFYQMQQIFGQLLESQLQYYVPDTFWRVFRLWGQAVNVREQQDALDFYQAIIDQMDEQIKIIGKEPIFRRKFQGVFSDQKICKDCQHRYEREEVFFALNVTVKHATLQDSLDQFVKGELLEGDNAFFCEKCNEKRNTVKRLCIKRLPPLLCIQLKRFDYDWEANRALKFDDYFKFPWILNMAPYMADRFDDDEDQVTPQIGEPLDISSPGGSQLNYELVGVVVHSGQANAGHYYSFIKDRRGTHMSNASRGKWFKFNDTLVESFEMTDATLESECFGGNYKVKVLDQASSYPEVRLRYWNAYLLFYEKVEEVRTPMSAKKSKMTMWRSGTQDWSSTKRNSDSLVELTELVHKGEKRGLFTHKMPARIEQVVRDENLRFVKNRDVYDHDYFAFVRHLAHSNLEISHKSPSYSDLCVESIQLTAKFLLNTYFRTKRKLRGDMSDWVSIISRLVESCKAACTWLVSYLATDSGTTYIRPMLLECPEKEIREAFAEILTKTMACFFQHGGVSTHRCFSELVESLLCLLAKDVVDNYRNCSQYFQVLSAYVQLGTKACCDMYGKNAFQRLAYFLIGQPFTTQNVDESVGLRRWSSLQARDFGPLHATLATLILNCDVAAYRTEALPPNATGRLPSTVSPQIYLKMSVDMHKFVFGDESRRYVREVVLSVREVGSTSPSIEDMILYCSYCNSRFTMSVLKNIMIQYTSAPANELKGLFSILTPLMLLEDPLQLKRLQCIIDGYVDEQDVQYEGLLAVIKSSHAANSCRSYQCIKFLVSVANKCTEAKEYLQQTSTRWHWAVNWLRKKMSDYYCLPASSTVTSNEDSTSKSFQRTMSAQNTLAEATALLTELESIEQVEDMETSTDTLQDVSLGDTSPPSIDFTDEPTPR